MRPTSQSAQPMETRKPSTAGGTISVNSTSLTHSVPMVPKETGVPPMAMVYTASMTTAKMGRASTRLVTTRSIRSETVRLSLRALRVQAFWVTVWIKA